MAEIVGFSTRVRGIKFHLRAFSGTKELNVSGDLQQIVNSVDSFFAGNQKNYTCYTSELITSQLAALGSMIDFTPKFDL